MKETEIICVVCPVGCRMKISMDGGELVSVKGNRCQKGEDYAREEMIDPKRTLPTSVKVIGGELPLVSVKTEKPIPKRVIFDAMKVIRKAEIEAPVKRGQVIIEDLLGMGIALVATRTVKEKN